MPKYYLINRSEESFVVNGSVLMRTGEKISLNTIRFLDLNVRDQLDFKYIAKSIDSATSIIFVRGTESSLLEENLSNLADVDSKERIEEVNSKFEHVDFLKTVTEVSELETARVFEDNKKLEDRLQEKVSEFDDTEERVEGLEGGASHILEMKDIQIFATSKRICDYNTISYEINGWSEWLNVVNHLDHPIMLKIKLQEGIIAIEEVPPMQTGRIIAGISEEVEISLHYGRSEVILGEFELDQRLNHTVFLNDCDYEIITVKETKIKVGRLITIEAPKEGKEENIHKVENSLSLKIGKIRVSFVVIEEKVRS
jgi:hypothetical protein